MYRITAFGVAAILTGCAGANMEARIAVLQNPQTKQTVECKVNPLLINVNGQVNNCIAAYKKAGYVLVADSADEQPTATTPR